MAPGTCEYKAVDSEIQVRDVLYNYILIVINRMVLSNHSASVLTPQEVHCLCKGEKHGCACLGEQRQDVPLQSIMFWLRHVCSNKMHEEFSHLKDIFYTRGLASKIKPPVWRACLGTGRKRLMIFLFSCLGFHVCGGLSTS